MAGLSISRLVKIFKRASEIRRSIQDRKMDLEKKINLNEYAKLYSKDMEELKEIAQQKDIPNVEEFNKEELVMAIEFADLAGEN